MKKLRFFLLSFLAVAFCGCQSVDIAYGQWHYSRKSLGSSLKFNGADVTVETNGTAHVKIEGYTSDQVEGTKAILDGASKIAGSVAAGMVQGAK